jgi:hypothetical protein
MIQISKITSCEKSSLFTLLLSRQGWVSGCTAHTHDSSSYCTYALNNGSFSTYLVCYVSVLRVISHTQPIVIVSELFVLPSRYSTRPNTYTTTHVFSRLGSWTKKLRKQSWTPCYYCIVTPEKKSRNLSYPSPRIAPDIKSGIPPVQKCFRPVRFLVTATPRYLS